MPLLAIIAVVLLVSCAVGGYSLIGWLPTRKADLALIARLAGLKPGGTCYDLGAGDGRVAAFLARSSPQTTVIGLEIALPFYLAGKLRQLCQRGDNLQIRFKNLFSQNLRDADTVYVFGIPDKLKAKLRPKLERELRPGARIISYVFAIDGWQPAAVERTHAAGAPIYLYIMPCLNPPM